MHAPTKKTFSRFFLHFWLWALLLTIVLGVIGFLLYMEVGLRLAFQVQEGNIYFAVTTIVVDVLLSLTLLVLLVVKLFRKQFIQALCLLLNLALMGAVTFVTII